ncbi:hypothetical protein [Rhizobium sp. BR 315]|uniref:hypothetical protein n=1 Tax=Rhizobium sp. BR 315 TaxID=3040014 RepID=UPI003D3485EF
MAKELVNTNASLVDAFQTSLKLARLRSTAPVLTHLNCILGRKSRWSKGMVEVQVVPLKCQAV